MSFWGSTATKPLESKWTPVRRAVAARPVGCGFVPIESQVAAVHELQAALGQGCQGVVIHGPSGSGRTAVSRQLCRVAGGLVLELNDPPLDFQASLTDRFKKSTFSDKNQRLGLMRVDGLTLEHRGWEKLAFGIGMPGVRLVVVATTAWWLWHREAMGPNWHDVCLKLLATAEIEHLANSARWRLDPRSRQIDESAVKEIEMKSEGLASEVSRLAVSEFFH